MDNIYVASDHAGFDRKEMIKEYLAGKGYKIQDFGAKNLDAKDDYPDFAFPLAEAVAQDEERGILFCGNAQGVCIVANKVDGVRAALGYNTFSARTSREDDNTNVLCVPGRDLTDEEAKEIVDTWLSTEFTGEERHLRRLDKVKKIEEDN